MDKRKIIQWEKDKLNVSTQEKKIVLVGGCFDLLHYGHITFLKQAKKYGDSLVVALESDEFILIRKKRKPVHTQKQRAEILAELRVVDTIICLPLFTTDSEYYELVQEIQPAVIVVTEGDKQLDNKKKQAGLVEARLEVAPYVKSFSTTNILQL